MTEEKDLELEKIIKEFREGVVTKQEELIFSTLRAVNLPPEDAERILAEFAFQTSPFEVALFVIAFEGEKPEEFTEDRLTSMKGHKFKFARFTTIDDAVSEVLKTAWFENWFKFKWVRQNASVYLLPGLSTDVTQLGNPKTKSLYEEGVFKIDKNDKLITHLDRPLANALQEPVEF